MGLRLECIDGCVERRVLAHHREQDKRSPRCAQRECLEGPTLPRTRVVVVVAEAAPILSSHSDDASSTMALRPPAQPMVCTQLRLKCRDNAVHCATQWGMAGTRGACDRQLCMHAVWADCNDVGAPSGPGTNATCLQTVSCNANGDAGCSVRRPNASAVLMHAKHAHW